MNRAGVQRFFSGSKIRAKIGFFQGARFRVQGSGKEHCSSTASGAGIVLAGLRQAQPPKKVLQRGKLVEGASLYLLRGHLTSPCQLIVAFSRKKCYLSPTL
jgi:hypothetical protein